MSLSTGNRLKWVKQSEIRNMSIECEKHGGINLSQGVCDLEVPSIVAQGAKQAIDDGVNAYTRYDGLNELREAIAKRQKNFSGMEVDPENEIVVSSGATGALFSAFLALLNAGDEVILFEPYYGYHAINLVSTLAVPVYVRMTPPDWTFSREDLDKVVTKKTKAILINTPGNPSGKVFTTEELKTISEFAIENDLFVFTDEIYEYFVYDDRQHIPPASLPGMRERTIMVSGLSKTYSITGWRVGYVICDAKWSTAIGYFSDMLYACAPAPLQMGAAMGLIHLGPEFYDNISKEYQKKRDRICDALNTAGLTPFVPQGAYYVLCDISGIPGSSGKKKVMHLLKEIKVASVPGEAFYHDAAGENLTRFCFAKEDTVLNEACRRLESYGSKNL
ncbi:MAG: aminotransferase [Deltaproteobacteria bacterium]|nr:MAG: aminotransferase [Deltaproteobacteria bacterium]RLC18731.1 MAG: aminotransferase [Deltaproteobacteria bacterium]